MSGVSESRNVGLLLYTLRYPCKLTQIRVITEDIMGSSTGITTPSLRWRTTSQFTTSKSLSLETPESDLELQDPFTAPLHHEEGLTVPHSDQDRDKLVPVYVRGEDGKSVR